jgi:hypothetical protein
MRRIIRHRKPIAALAAEIALVVALAFAAFGTVGAQPAEAGSVNGTTAWNYCQWFNPNPSGYIISSVDYVNAQGGYTSTIQCRAAPTVVPNLGPLCIQIHISWFYDPPGIQTWGWYAAPSWACPPL